MNEITTERLLLRPYEEADFVNFAGLHGSFEVTAKMHAGPLVGKRARDLFDGYREAWARDGFGMRAAFCRRTGRYVGECGFWHRPDAGGYTLRYMLGAEWWDKGLSKEMVAALLDEGFGRAGLEDVFAIAMAVNHRSVKVLDRMGMVIVEEDFRGIEGFLRFHLAKSDWLAVRDGGLLKSPSR